MSLNDTPSGERAHIVFFGVRNVGKSSLVNAVTSQALAVVSDMPGTTTDPVRKAMELSPAGPVLIVDTPGIDDTGNVGDLRVQRSLAAIDETDVAVLVVDSTRGLTSFDERLLETFHQKRLPCVIAENKNDLLEDRMLAAEKSIGLEVRGSSVRPATTSLDSPTAESIEDDRTLMTCRISVSAKTGAGIEELKEALGAIAATATSPRQLVSDLLVPGDMVVLVIPLDSAAPKGRIILPQQQVIRDVLDAGAFPCATSVKGLSQLLANLTQPPRLVITDSQVFGAVNAALPPEVPLTSFSILMARYKGDLPAQMAAVHMLEELTDEDTVLIAEGCTHHRQCDDIGTVKLPGWIRQISGANPQFAFTSGREFPDDLSPYAVVVHCGGCMLNTREMQSRLSRTRNQHIPCSNYGMAIARAHNILSRALAPLQ